jgi:hypothetical protein
MGFTLTVKGKDTIYFGKDMISSAHADVSTPLNSMAKSSTVAVTVWVTGKLFSTDIGSSNSKTSKLFDWSLVSAQDADSYREVTVEVIHANQTPFRTIHLPNAFVVDYSERYDDNKGFGEFSLILRQKADKIPDIKTTEDGQ